MPNVRTVPNCPKACKHCRVRKVKCNGATPCSNCLSHEKDCWYPPSLRGKRNHTKARPPLEDRLARIEALIPFSRLHNAEAPASGDADNETTGPAPPIHNLSQSSEKAMEGDSSSHYERQSQASPKSFLGSRGMDHGADAAQSSPTLDPTLDTSYPPLQPTYTPTPLYWDASAAPVPISASAPAPATISSAHSLDGRSLGKSNPSPDFQQDEACVPSQTRIWEHHGPGSWLSLCSEPGVSWVTERTGGVDFGKISQRLTAAWNRRWKYGDQAGSRLTGQEPDATTAWRYSTAYFEYCFESIFGVVHRPEFEARLHAHLQQGGTLTPRDDVAWYALRNIVYAAGCRQLLLRGHADSTSYAEAQAEAFGYFQNALSVHTDLIYGPSGLDAVRALVAMTFYAEATANEGFEYMICANAVRLAQAKGLHRQPSKSSNLSDAEITHRNWLFWAIFCLEKQISFRSGRPSAIDDDNISCEVPDHAAPGSTIHVAYFTHAVAVGKIVMQMSRRLCSVNAMRQKPDDLVDAAISVGAQIEAWRESIGPEMFQTPGRPPSTANPLLGPNIRPLHITYLHYMYCSAIQSAYAIFAFPWVGSILGLEQNASFQRERASKASKVAEAARKNILIAKAIELDAALPQWASFYFPMSGLTNLFVYVLNSPRQPSAQADVALLDVAAGHYSHMEYLTSSERGLPFTREVANLARATLERVNRKTSSNTIGFSMSPLADGGHAGGERDPDQQPPLLPSSDMFDVEQFDLEGWDVYSTVLMDGALAANTEEFTDFCPG